jgi:polar amino acid transport system substrate-binding protein
MNRIAIFFASAMLAVSVHSASLEALQKKGEIIIGVKDSSPPFSQIDPKTRILKGYDIEFAQGVAKRLKLKPVFKTLESDDRLPWLKEGTVDLVVADLSRTPEREKEIDFSIGYFVTDTRILAKKGRFKAENDIAMSHLAVANTSSSAKYLRKNYPKSKIAEFQDTPEMLKALTAGVVDGIAGDGPVLTALLAQIPAAQKPQYEVSEFALELKIFGMGLPKGEKKLQTAINTALMDMETSGEAEAIFNRWFGPQSSMPMMRIFKINNRRVE